MPVVVIDLWEGRSDEEKAQVIQGITKVLTDTLGISETAVTVIIHDIPKQNWGRKGRPSSDKAQLQ